MLNFISQHKFLFIFFIFSLFMLPITYKDAVHDGITGYENIFLCCCSVLSSMCMGCLCDIALNKGGDK